jgi:hypothetical protein
MLRTVVLAVALLSVAATTAAPDASVCGLLSDLVTARLRWEIVRKGRVDPADHEMSCRVYDASFIEAVTARQAASHCKSGIELQRTLELLDSEINAFNELIAVRCGG